MPLVHSIASMVSGKGLPPNIDYHDLVSDGTVGLMKAWERFDPKRGVKFETYASYRIRGEILDGLKNYSPVPYRIQVMIRDLAKKGFKETLKTKLKAREEKLLSKKELSESEFKTAVRKIKKIVSASALMYLMSLEDLTAKRDVNVAAERGPVDQFEFKELKDRLLKTINTLPQEQQSVVDLFFNQGLKQREISKKLGLSRPKVCRLLARTVKRLQHDGKMKG
ncbi:MAG: sigma-70 family RNA polymerase sigma factor [Candidatus Saganbacteria bacterium]|nr:sigma-70 family RNA polymerase sigma factor [Candidatus Saganbacteria bacterium]